MEKKALTATPCVAVVEVTSPYSYWGWTDLRTPLL